MTTVNKAHAGGLVGALTVLTTYLFEQVPAIAALPEGPEMALQFLISAAIGWGVVYIAPANKPVS